MRRLLLCTISVYALYFSNLHAQNARLDSIKINIENKFTSDLDRFTQCIALSNSLLDFNVTLSEYYSSLAVEYAQSLDSLQKGIALVQQGKFLKLRNDLDSAQLILYQAEIYLDSKKRIFYAMLLDRERAGILQKRGAHDEALKLYDRVGQYFDSTGQSRELANTHVASLRSHVLSRNNEENKIFLKQTWDLISENNQDQLQPQVLFNMGEVLRRLGQFPEALEHFIEGIQKADTLGNLRSKMKSLNGMATTYTGNIGDLKSGLKYFREALDVAVELEDQTNYVGILGNTAYTLLLMDSLQEAYAYYDEAINISTKNGLDCLLPFATEGLALVLEKQKKYNAAKYYFKRANDMAIVCQLGQNQITTLQGLGRVFRSTKEFSKAADIFGQALELANDNDFTNRAKDLTFELYQTYKQMGEYEKALEFHESFKSVNDALFSEANIRKVTKLEEQYKFDLERANIKAERELEEFKLNDKLEHQVLYKNLIIAGSILLLIIIISLYFGYVNKMKSNALLTELNQEKNQLIGIVAHDLRSPLNNIKGLIGIVKSDSNALSKDQTQYLNLIDESVDRQRKMISRVLDINAIESQNINLRLEKLDLGKIIDLVVHNYRNNALNKKIELLDQTNGGKHMAEVDKNYLIQVLENIVSNAIKFSPEDSQIKIKAVDLQERICVCVEDEGPGISTEDQDELFKPYKKLTARPTGDEESSGLGLSIVKKYVDAMGGKIKIDSELGQGTRFMIEFKAA